MKLASIQAIPEALALPFETPINVIGRAPTGNAEPAVMTNCDSYFALRAKGFEASAEGDFAAMKIEGARCQALKTLRRVISGSRAPLVKFSFDGNVLSLLPPVLGPEPSPGERTRRENATKQGISWSAFDPQATITVRNAESAIVRGPDWTTKLEILARGNLTGDGATDILLRTVSYRTEGSWSEIRLRILRHDGKGAALVIQSELPL